MILNLHLKTKCVGLPSKTVFSAISIVYSLGDLKSFAKPCDTLTEIQNAIIAVGRKDKYAQRTLTFELYCK